jgi:hypothetical protein
MYKAVITDKTAKIKLKNSNTAANKIQTAIRYFRLNEKFFTESLLLNFIFEYKAQTA